MLNFGDVQLLSCISRPDRVQLGLTARSGAAHVERTMWLLCYKAVVHLLAVFFLDLIRLRCSIGMLHLEGEPDSKAARLRVLASDAKASHQRDIYLSSVRLGLAALWDGMQIGRTRCSAMLAASSGKIAHPLQNRCK